MTAATAVRTTYTMPAADGGGGRRGTDERALVVLAQQGSSEAFASLVRLHQRRAYAVCRAIVLTHEDAEDAVQEGFLHAFRARDRFLPDRPFGSCPYGSMANACSAIAR